MNISAKCASLSDPIDGHLVMSTNGSVSIVTIFCPIGYSINGSAVLTCGQDSKWDEDVPNCGE